MPIVDFGKLPATFDFTGPDRTTRWQSYGSHGWRTPPPSGFLPSCTPFSMNPR